MLKQIALMGLAMTLVGCNNEEIKPSNHIVMHANPNCGCCNAHRDHLELNGFTVTKKDTGPEMPSLKRALGVPDSQRSCHTATIDGLVIEGHVPAKDIKRALEAGVTGVLAVPNMPIGSPGMEIGSSKDPYTVNLVQDGNVSVYARYE